MQTQGLPPPYPRSENKDRCAGEGDLSGAKPALTLAVPQVSPPTSPTSWAGHAPCWKFGIDDFPATTAVFGEGRSLSRRMRTRQKGEKFEDSSVDFADLRCCSFSS